jgi:hypothetical protein
MLPAAMSPMNARTVKDGNLADVYEVRDAGLPADWNVISMPVNVMLVGDTATTSALVEASRPYLPEPIFVVRGGNPFTLPNAKQIVTLILVDVERIALVDQHGLNVWLDKHRAHPRVISTAQTPVLPLVRAGAFLESLYYRLNMVYLDLLALESSAF